MKSWQPSQVDAFQQSESSPSKTCWIQSLSFIGPKCHSCLVEDDGNTWNRSQSTSLVLHAFHVCSIIFLIHVCISENDNERTLWRSINSSNVSNTIIIKNDFTFESNVSNVVVSEKVMSSSLDDRLPPLVHPIALSPHASHWTHLLVSLIWHIAPTCVDLSVLKTLLSKPSRAQIAPFGLRQLPLQQYRIIRCYLTSLYLIFVWILHWPYPIIFHTFCIGPTRSFSIPDPIIKSGFTTLLPL